MLFAILTSSLTALIVVQWAYFKILKIAKDKNLVDNPDARKLQKTPVPVMGGIAVFIGVIAGIFVGATIHSLNNTVETTRLLSVVCAMMFMLYIGAMDDIIGLTPTSRFIIEILAVLGLIFTNDGCIDSFHGIWGVQSFSWWIGVPLTIFAGVGIINAINMIDGVNGLSSGLCIAYCAVFGTIFIKSSDVPNAVLAFSMVASLIPFFMHNVFGLKSRMFIGDAGTMVLGILMTWFAICTLKSDSIVASYYTPNGYSPVALSIAILSVPIFDTIRVMTVRIAHGKSPFLPDKTHLHHAFVIVGISHTITALSEIMIDFVVIAILSLSVKSGASMTCQLYIVILSSVILVWGTYMFLQFNMKHKTNILHKITHFGIRTHLGRTEWWKGITNYLDSPEEEYNKPEVIVHQKDRIALRFEHVDTKNIKEMDRKRILEFMKGRVEVFVEDIVRNSGADPTRVYPILTEEEQNGYITIIRRTSLGAPEIVSLITEPIEK